MSRNLGEVLKFMDLEPNELLEYEAQAIIPRNYLFSLVSSAGSLYYVKMDTQTQSMHAGSLEGKHSCKVNPIYWKPQGCP